MKLCENYRDVVEKEILETDLCGFRRVARLWGPSNDLKLHIQAAEIGFGEKQRRASQPFFLFIF
jgi:hypothetical protein